MNNYEKTRRMTPEDSFIDILFNKVTNNTTHNYIKLEEATCTYEENQSIRRKVLPVYPECYEKQNFYKVAHL